MKKIISLVCVIAMLFAFAVTANAAADNEVTLTIKEQTAEKTVLSLDMTTTHTVASYTFYIDVAPALAAGATVTPVAGNALKAQLNTSQKMVLVTFMPTDGTTFTGTANLATIEFSAVDDAFDVARKAESSRTKTLVTAKDPEGGTDLTVTDTFTISTDVTVEPFAAEFTPETKKADAAVDATATDIELEKDPATAYTNIFNGTAVFKGSFTADSNYGEAGLIWVKDGVETANTYKVADGSAVSGAGTFEYSVAMYAIPDGVTISAIPYYVTAE